MARGRKPLPKEKLILRDPFRKDRDRPGSTIGEPIAVEDIGQKCQVSGLKSATRRAREIYWRLCGQVAATKILEESFCTQLFIYAVEYDHWMTCNEDIKRNGNYLTVEGKKGTFVVDNPCIKQRKRCEETLIRLGSEFGFTPVSRMRLKMPALDSKDKGIAGFMAIFAKSDSDNEPDEQ